MVLPIDVKQSSSRAHCQGMRLGFRKIDHFKISGTCFAIADSVVMFSTAWVGATLQPSVVTRQEIMSNFGSAVFTIFTSKGVSSTRELGSCFLLYRRDGSAQHSRGPLSKFPRWYLANQVHELPREGPSCQRMVALRSLFDYTS